nr:MAG TPA: hypothetical protein [Caudoviricetes sp.]
MPYSLTCFVLGRKVCIHWMPERRNAKPCV